MPAISFIHPDGRKERVEAAEGESAMQAATRHGIDEIVAECGGNGMCATCHVYVDESWTGRLPAIGDDEDALLDGAAADVSRTAACPVRLNMAGELDGLVLRLPDRQI